MLIDLLNHRRAVRHYSDQPIDADTVRACLEQARLAPSSSNMQLYQFIHVTDAATLQTLATACFGQQSATTAQQMVVFVTRQDLSRERARAVMALEADNIRRTSPPENQEKRLANSRAYYGKFLPFMYARCFGLLGVLRKLLFGAVSLFRPLYTDCSEADMRVVVHKSCALAAQTFMLAMREAGYDTCPLEGLDSRRVKRTLGLPRGAEINMIVSCGIRKEGHGIWGERHRLPFAEVYRRV